MLQYCPCVTQLSHINHCIEPGELLHLKAHMQQGEGREEKGVVDVIEGWIKGEENVTGYDLATHQRLVSREALVR